MSIASVFILIHKFWKYLTQVLGDKTNMFFGVSYTLLALCAICQKKLYLPFPFPTDYQKYHQM